MVCFRLLQNEYALEQEPENQNAIALGRKAQLDFSLCPFPFDEGRLRMGVKA